jgi:hypothetical protein
MNLPLLDLCDLVEVNMEMRYVIDDQESQMNVYIKRRQGVMLVLVRLEDEERSQDKERRQDRPGEDGPTGIELAWLALTACPYSGPHAQIAGKMSQDSHNGSRSPPP